LAVTWAESTSSQQTSSDPLRSRGKSNSLTFLQRLLPLFDDEGTDATRYKAVNGDHTLESENEKYSRLRGIKSVAT
jgi:hypothetical protein